MEEVIAEFILSERVRVEKLFAAKHRAGFSSKRNLANWFIDRLKAQNFECYYCKFSIFNIRKLINDGKLKTRKTGFGVRGLILEIDKMDNPSGYSSQNCVLSCYYCNNDKSYTCGSEEYQRFFGTARNTYFNHLLNKN